VETTVAFVLAVCVPVVLMAMIWVLGALEAWMLQPDERAARLHLMLQQIDEPDEIEQQAARLLAEVADRP
jgi:cytochrome c-type biogenesis protein CcmH/NrfG